MTYLITFSCYGRRLHGAESGSVDRLHNSPGTPLLDAAPVRAGLETGRMAQEQYELDEPRRSAVLKAIQEVCARRVWTLLAAHVRSTHVHAVVEAEVSPERVMNDFKAYATRRLNRMGLDGAERRRWAYHGSTRWLWKPANVSAAIEYVVREQGPAMAVFELFEY